MQRPEVQRDRIRVDAIRRALFERVALLSCVFGLALCVAMLLAASAIGGLGNAISGPPELTGLQQLRCANLNAIPEQNRSTSQRAEFARTCSRWTP
jgi:hypothetical protein